MAGKQIEFNENQTHDKNFEMALVVFSVVCIALCFLAAAVVGGGGI